jgi:hypothetical protein
MYRIPVVHAHYSSKADHEEPECQTVSVIVQLYHALLGQSRYICVVRGHNTPKQSGSVDTTNRTPHQLHIIM